MKFGRIFVTSFATIAVVGLAACSGGSNKEKDKQNSRQKATAAYLAEGKALFGQNEEIRKELKDLFKIEILDKPHAVAAGKTEDHRTLGRLYNWSRLTLAERQSAKEKLATYMTAITRILEIHTKKGVYVDPLQTVLDRKAAVESHQISLQNFERFHGEMAPGQPGIGSVYRGIDGP